MIPAFAPTLFMPKVSAFNPVSLITGAGGFWEADKGVTLSGSNVTAWADQSAFGNNLADLGTHPQFSATGWLSAFPGITFNGTSNQLSNTSFSFSSSSTLSFFFLLTDTGGSGNGRWMSFGNNGIDYNTSHQFAFVAAGTANFSLYQVNLTGSPVTCGTPGSGVAALMGGVFDGANFTAWKNAVSGSSGACTDTFTTTAIGIADDANSDFRAGTIAFAGITQKAMNSTDWTNLKNYCNSTWGTSL